MENVIKVLQDDSYREFYGIENAIKVGGIVFNFDVLEREWVDTEALCPVKVKLLSVNGQEPTQQVSDLFNEALDTKWNVYLYIDRDQGVITMKQQQDLELEMSQPTKMSPKAPRPSKKKMKKWAKIMQAVKF